MNELELKYGCNPNQKPASILMKDGGDLPVTVLSDVMKTISYEVLTSVSNRVKRVYFQC